MSTTKPFPFVPCCVNVYIINKRIFFFQFGSWRIFRLVFFQTHYHWDVTQFYCKKLFNILHQKAASTSALHQDGLHRQEGSSILRCRVRRSCRCEHTTADWLESWLLSFSVRCEGTGLMWWRLTITVSCQFCAATAVCIIQFPGQHQPLLIRQLEHAVQTVGLMSKHGHVVSGFQCAPVKRLGNWLIKSTVISWYLINHNFMGFFFYCNLI